MPKTLEIFKANEDALSNSIYLGLSVANALVLMWIPKPGTLLNSDASLVRLIISVDQSEGMHLACAAECKSVFLRPT